MSKRGLKQKKNNNIRDKRWMSQISVPLVLFFHFVKNKAQSTLLPYEPCKLSALLFFIQRSFLDWTELFQIRWHEIQLLSKWVFLFVCFLSPGFGNCTRWQWQFLLQKSDDQQKAGWIFHPRYPNTYIPHQYFYFVSS